jgi:hypothetical protein
MIDRAYTVKELDRLRKVVEDKLTWGYYNISWAFAKYNDREEPKNWRGSFYAEAVLTKMVEERVRTHMLAGHTAEQMCREEDEELVARHESMGYVLIDGVWCKPKTEPEK